jgi:hypothetical protein
MRTTLTAILLLFGVATGLVTFSIPQEFLPTWGGRQTTPPPTPTVVVQPITWTEEEMAQNPIGYCQHVQENLKAALENFKKARRGKALTMERLTKILSEKKRKLAAGEHLAAEFAEALTAGTFPATLLGRSYSEEQLRLQLSLTVAEMNGLKEIITEIVKASAVAEEEILKDVIRIERTEAEIAILDTRVEIYRGQATDTAALDMVATANSLLSGHQLFLKENPVRDISTLMEELERNATATSYGAASAAQVDEFLRNFAAKKSAGKSGSLQSKGIPPAPGDRDE